MISINTQDALAFKESFKKTHDINKKRTLIEIKLYHQPELLTTDKCYAHFAADNDTKLLISLLKVNAPVSAKALRIVLERSESDFLSCLPYLKKIPEGFYYYMVALASTSLIVRLLTHPDFNLEKAYLSGAYG